jgi:curli biogenesis system outer membrane secretion channel CsgG
VTDLGSVKRIYVASFGDDETSKQLQAMVVSSLVASKKFVVTENEKKADAVLKGAALQKTSQEVHAYGSGTAVGATAGGHSSSVSGSGGSFSGSSSGGFAAKHMGIDDSSVNTETIDRASAAVRLVNADGDVIWTTTQESHGAKYKGATADVADKIVSQLTRDVEKASKPSFTQN